MWPNPQGTADLVTFTEEILNEKLHFCAVLPNIFHDVKNIVETFFEYYQIFIMKLFSKIVNLYKLPIVFEKIFIVNLWLGPKYTPV